jgi:hypothetical protein
VCGVRVSFMNAAGGGAGSSADRHPIRDNTGDGEAHSGEECDPVGTMRGSDRRSARAEAEGCAWYGACVGARHVGPYLNTNSGFARLPHAALLLRRNTRGRPITAARSPPSGRRFEGHTCVPGRARSRRVVRTARAQGPGRRRYRPRESLAPASPRSVPARLRRTRVSRSNRGARRGRHRRQSPPRRGHPRPESRRAAPKPRAGSVTGCFWRRRWLP